MRRIAVLMLVTILAACLIAPCYAQENSLETELESVLFTGYKYYNSFHNVDGYIADKFDILIYPNVTGTPIMTKQFSVKNPNGKTDTIEYEYWYMLDKYDFQTFESIESVRKYIGNCISEDYIDDFLTFDKVIDADSGNTKIIKLFEETTNGELTVCYKWDYDGLKFQYTDFQIRDVDEASALAMVTLGCAVRNMPYNLDTPFGYFYKNEPGWLPSVETVEFTKTADGWRISGGTMFDVMLGNREPSYVVPPNTGDSTPIIITLLAISALGIVCELVIKKRKAKI